jgi:hypothetical protein
LQVPDKPHRQQDIDENLRKYRAFFYHEWPLLPPSLLTDHVIRSKICAVLFQLSGEKIAISPHFGVIVQCF